MRRYIGVFGCRWGDSFFKSVAKSLDAKGIGSRGWRDSCAMLMGRAKREGDVVKEEKAERREGDAGESQCVLRTGNT